MGLFGGNQDNQERFYNLAPDKVYAGIVSALNNSKRFTLKTEDELSCSCTFSTGVSMTTWGEKMSASVIPSGNGSKVSVTTAAKIGGNAIWQGSKNAKVISKFFEELSSALKS